MSQEFRALDRLAGPAAVLMAVVAVGLLALPPLAAAQLGGRGAPMPVEVVHREPYQSFKFASFESTSSQLDLALDAVPAGKRLVVESIFVEVELPPGQEPLAQFGITNGFAALLLTRQTTIKWVGTHAARLYLTGPVSPSFTVFQFPVVAPFSGAVWVMVTGYLTTAP